MNGLEKEKLAALFPVNFFQITQHCKWIEGHLLPPPESEEGSCYCLPSTSSLCYEEAFATVSIGWNKEGLAVLVTCNQPVQETSFPDVTRGDSVELFIDTRDIKTSGMNSRFCHHFAFLPENSDGHLAAEVTHFRTEDDSHPLADPSHLTVKPKLQKDRYLLNIFIPSQCLYGYDPEQFDRLGFSYRINRPDGGPQHFSAVTEEYKIEGQPALWSSLQLVK